MPLKWSIAPTASECRRHLYAFWHFDHTGGNENLGNAGVMIVAHDEVCTRMSTDQFIEALQRRALASPAGS
ncbi:MAG: hypothetical protein ACFB5Z_17140 [Elainellaceae cyanobacterium]